MASYEQNPTKKNKELPESREYLFDESWFEVTVLTQNENYTLKAVREKDHFEDVVFYMIELADTVVLIDTGSGFGPIHKLLPKDKKIVALLSHSDWDHTGGAIDLSEVYIMATAEIKYELDRLQKGWPTAEIDGLIPNKFHRPLKDPTALSRFSLPPIPNPRLYNLDKSGQQRLTFENLTIQVLATPGHTPGSVCFFIEGEENGEPFGDLYTADTLYPAFQDLQAVGSNPYDYLESLKMLKNTLGNRITRILPGHNATTVDPELLDRHIDALEGKLKPTSISYGSNKIGEYVDELYEGFTLRLPKNFRAT
jgi:glyoxylase-like metal-dependent hydrolase (beta-lactamase superfamily II)